MNRNSGTTVSTAQPTRLHSKRSYNMESTSSIANKHDLTVIERFNTMSAATHSTSISPLLSLPPEIRENIWRLVLGVEGETIHLYRHEYVEEGIGKVIPPLELDSSSGKRYTLKPSCCRRSQEWDDAYELSQKSDDFTPDHRDRRGRLKQDADGVLPSYNARHRHCRQQDIQCRHGKHTMQCRASRVGLNVDCICVRRKNLHLSLLRVCRSIYFEAAHLPYKLNTFSFPNEANLAFFANEILKPWQRSMIPSLEVALQPPVVRSSAVEPEDSDASKQSQSEVSIQDLTFNEGLESSLKLFPNLQRLKLSLPFVNDPYLSKLAIPEMGEGKMFDVPAIPRVDVIVGADTDMCREYETGTREERRELAFAVEMFLQGKCIELTDRSLAWWQFLLCNGRAVPCENHEQPFKAV